MQLLSYKSSLLDLLQFEHYLLLKEVLPQESVYLYVSGENMSH